MEFARACWSPTWVSAQQLTEPDNLPPKPGLTGNTLRQILQVTVGGSRCRVTLSNEYGHEPLIVDCASLAPAQGQSVIDAGRCHRLTFDGTPRVVVLPGQRAQSDPVKLSMAPLSNLALTLHVESAPRDITGHPGSRTTSFLQPGDAVMDRLLRDSVRVEHWYFIARVDIVTTTPTQSIVILGDSITDGRGSTTDANDRWPNHLARRLLGAGHSIAVLNQGLGGNRVLNDGLGPSALSRFERDVLSLPDVRWLIIFEGINDIGTDERELEPTHSASVANDLIGAYERMIASAHAQGSRVYGVTLMPFEGAIYHNRIRESHRQRVNEFIRRGAFDAVIDFDTLASDPGRRARLSPSVDGGDGLHPSAQGHRFLGESVDLGLFDVT